MAKKPDSLALTSHAVTRLEGIAHLPGDKSISHRSLLLTALAEGTSHVSGLLEGEDVLATAAAMRAMGATIEKQTVESLAPVWKITGVGLGNLKSPKATLDMGNSGTTTRLLMGIVAGHPIKATFTGDASLSKRPMSRVTIPLRDFGASIEASEGERLPLTIEGCKHPRVLKYTTPMASAQVKSAVLFAGLNAIGTTVLCEKTSTRDHSERMLSALGAKIDVKLDDSGGRTISLSGQQKLTATDIIVPADISSAAFPMAAAAMIPNSDITLMGVGINPLRTGIIGALQAFGADITVINQRDAGGEPVADIRVRGSALQAVNGLDVEPSTMIDEFPVLFCAAATAAGTTTLTGLAELRVKESDRLSVMVAGLRANGIKIEELEDGVIIKGLGDTEKGNGKVPGGGVVETHLDHRIAMSFMVLGMMAEKPVTIDDASPINTSFPTFIEMMNGLGAKLG